MKNYIAILAALSSSHALAVPYVVNVEPAATQVTIGAEFSVDVTVRNLGATALNTSLMGTLPPSLELGAVAGGVGWICASTAQRYQCSYAVLPTGTTATPVRLFVRAAYGLSPTVVTAVAAEQTTAWPTTGQSPPITILVPDVIFLSDFEP